MFSHRYTYVKPLGTFVLAAAALAFAGCGGKKSAPANLSGRVTLNGQPLSGGTLTFHSDAGVYSTTVESDGSYRAVDMPVGELTVTVDNDYLNPDKKVEVYKGVSGGPPGMSSKGGYPGMAKAAPSGGASVAPKGKLPGTGPVPEGAAIVKEGTFVKLPGVYKKKETSTVKIQVQSGDNNKDIELTGDAK